MTHVRGFLQGVQECGVDCEIYSGVPVGFDGFKNETVPAEQRFFTFTESAVLEYNRKFAKRVYEKLRGRKIIAIYQRHGRFVISPDRCCRNG